MPAVSVFGWIVMMQRIGNSNNNIWQKTWPEYRNGFGTAGSDFWLGLERVYQLTQSRKYRLRVELLLSGSWKSVEYWYFIIGDEANAQYAINVAGYVQNT
jgi:hypothetical protein